MSEQNTQMQVHLAAPGGQAVQARRPLVAGAANVTIAAALVAGIGAMFGWRPTARTTRRARNYPTMVISPRAEIVAWNEAVDARKAAKRERQRIRRADAIGGAA